MKTGSLRPETRGAAAGPVLTRSARRAAELLDLTQKDLAQIIGVSPATVSRLPHRPLDPAAKEGELAILFVRMFRSLDALVGGDVDSARTWLHAQNHHLAGVPAELIQTVTGLVDVVEYLDAMRGKV
jgi:DNA-directed RNA polymerase specialized sigma24 family protein